MVPTTSDPVSGLQPSVPKDFQVFINLVDLCRYGVFIPSGGVLTCSSHHRKLLLRLPLFQFLPWILPFGYKIVTMSNKFQYISGFYKLLATCFTICKKSNYFNVCVMFLCVGYCCSDCV